MLLFLKVMATEFIAEMGDKTQLMLIAMTSRFKLRDIIIGTAVAILVLNGAAVLAGGLVGSVIPEWLIKIVAAIAFMFFALTSISGGEDEHEGEPDRAGFRLAPIAVFVTFLLAELGDKTQLTALTFGANEGLSNGLCVWLACSVGLFLADVIGLIVGYMLQSKIPHGFMNLLAFLIFAVFGVITLRRGLILLLGTESSAIVPILIGAGAAFAIASAILLLRSRTGKAGDGDKG